MVQFGTLSLTDPVEALVRAAMSPASSASSRTSAAAPMLLAFPPRLEGTISGGFTIAVNARFLTVSLTSANKASPARATAPPITTSSGLKLKRFTAFAMPIPRCLPAS